MQDEEISSTENTSMESRQLHSSRKEAMKKILEFSGEDNELDIDEWLFDLTNLFSLMKLKDETKILETMGKLTGPALRWYQENLRSFTEWNDAEKALKDRFKTFTSGSQMMQEFFQIQQEENQSITSFYETVMRKYRKAKKFITEQQVITVLQNGVKKSLKEHLIRNEEDIHKPDEWLHVARQEEHIQKRLQQQHDGGHAEETQQPLFEPMLPTATINSRSFNGRPPHQRLFTSYNHHKQQHQQRQPLQNNYSKMTQHQATPLAKQTPQAELCLICDRTNHSTMKYFYKKEKGCFKCEQSNHRIRDCSKRHFFD